MNRNPVIKRFAVAIALCLSAASLVAFAGETREITEIEVIANGVSEKMKIEDLAIGETRQLYSEAGTLVTATRTAESLELDVGGTKTSIRMLDGGALDDPEILALIAAHDADAEPGSKRVIRIHAGDGEHAAHADGKHRRVIVLGDKGGVHDLDGADGELRIDKDGAGPHVIVKRRIVKSDATAD
jgi:hypothetical protein